MNESLERLENAFAAVIAEKHQGRGLIGLSRGALASTVRGVDL